MPEKEIQAVVLDVGKVLIRLDFGQVAEAVGLSPNESQTELMGKINNWDLYDGFERGKIPSDAFRQEFSRLVGRALDEDTFLRVWNSILREEVPGIGEIVESVASRFPLYALSNCNEDHAEYMFANYPWLAHFRQVFTSFELGARKPEADIYRAVIRQVGVPAGAILFVDDRPENVEGARKVGLQAHLCENSPDDLHRIFRQHGIIE